VYVILSKGIIVLLASKIGNNNKLFFIIAAVLIATLLVDTALERISELIGASEMKTEIFIVISVIAYGVGQFIILSSVHEKTKKMLSGSGANNSFVSQIKRLHRIVLVMQFILSAILVSIIVLVIFESRYNTILITASTVISYGFAIALAGLLARSFFKWFKSNRNSVVLSYGLAATAITINLAFAVSFMIPILISKPPEIMDHLLTGEVAGAFDANSPLGVISSANVISGIIAFILMWISTALLFRHHSKKLGLVKYWAIITIPLAYFISQFTPLFLTQVVSPFLRSDPIFAAVVFTLIFSISKPAGGILFGVAFWTISRALKESSVVRDYMKISSLGVVLLFVSSQASVIAASYPPFGLVTVSFVGLSSYMMFIGLYTSAVSVSQDMTLRQSIRKQVFEESARLLDSIGTAHMENEITRTVMLTAKRNSAVLEEQSGVQPSIDEGEMKEYLEYVLAEVNKLKK
jgi:hypothetical protein